MNYFSVNSKLKLITWHPYLRLWASKMLEYHDCSVVYGVRSDEEQKILFDAGLSKTLESKHLKQEDGFSHAIDLVPYFDWMAPNIPWDNEKYFYQFIGMGKIVALDMGIELINGSDWDNDGDMDDQKFMDLAHWELVK